MCRHVDIQTTGAACAHVTRMALSGPCLLSVRASTSFVQYRHVEFRLQEQPAGSGHTGRLGSAVVSAAPPSLGRRGRDELNEKLAFLGDPRGVRGTRDAAGGLLLGG